MTDTDEAITETRAEKAGRLRKAGYVEAAGPGRCCLCSRPIHRGQFIARLPDSWKPQSKRRHAHYKCVGDLVAKIRARVEAAR